MSDLIGPVKREHIRAVFMAMFDAFDIAGPRGEERWEDLIAALNTTGRFVLGYPHLESSESDIFGALDDIAEQLARTKADIERTTADARLILGELRDTIGMGEPESADAPPLADHSESSGATIEPEPGIEPEYSAPEPTQDEAVAAVPSPDKEAPAPSDKLNGKPRSATTGRVRQGPHYDRDAMFEILRRAPSMDAAAKEIGVSGKAVRDRLDVLEGHGELPDDIRDRFRRRRGSRIVPVEPLPMDTLERFPEQQEAQPEPESFEDRRHRLAREQAERTWQQTHPEASAR